MNADVLNQRYILRVSSEIPRMQELLYTGELILDTMSLGLESTARTAPKSVRHFHPKVESASARK